MPGIEQIAPRSKPRINIKEDEWLNETIDGYLTDEMTPPRVGVFHPSTLSNACDRFVWLNYYGHMPTSVLDAKLARVFSNGNYLEKRVETWFKGLGILMGREIPVKLADPPMSGRIDFIIMHQEHGISPIELKSINTAGFGRLTAPKDEHALQLQMYLNMGNYSVGTVLYENKNDQKIKSFIVERDIKQWDELLERCRRIQNMTVPPAKCTGASWCGCKRVDQEDLLENLRGV
tara:strand:+ start:2609 stop:3307 length:699 start_codon:yes stop_codon:yes gene_type:complete